MSRKKTYADFVLTGYQDCANMFDTSDHRRAWERLGKPRGNGAATKVVREAWEEEDSYAQWLKNADVDEILQDGLELRAAYKAWRDAWQSCAESAVRGDMKQWIEDEDEA